MLFFKYVSDIWDLCIQKKEKVFWVCFKIIGVHGEMKLKWPLLYRFEHFLN